MNEMERPAPPDPAPVLETPAHRYDGGGDEKRLRQSYRDAVRKRVAAERAEIRGKSKREGRTGGGDRARSDQVAAGEDRPPYFIDADGYLCRTKVYREAEVKIRLANFSAKIVEQIHVDDGAERTSFYTIQGTLRGAQNLPAIEVPATQFQGMSWVHRWGCQAILEPGRTVADSVRHSIQLASAGASARFHYSHTGWRKIAGSWAYLHAGGAVGMENVSVRLPAEYPEYQRLILPATPDDEQESIKTSLAILELGKREVTLPLLVYTFLAPLTTVLPTLPPFSLYLYGVSGSFKTTLAALALSHFGSFTSISNLPNFADTPGSIEKRSFRLKDTLFLLDDYAPSHRKQDHDKKEELCQAAIRIFANRTGKGRLKADSSEMARTCPRGMLLITGEEAPGLQSTLARILLLEVSRSDIDRERLTALQNQAHRLPHAMTSYLLWIKEKMEAINDDFAQRFQAMRDRATTDGQHGRIAEMAAFLLFTLETLGDWLCDKGVLSECQAKDFTAQGGAVLQNLSAAQNKRIQGNDPVVEFFDNIGTLVYQRRARLDSCDHEGVAAGGGDRIGFLDDAALYLHFNSAWNAVANFISKEGGVMPFAKNTLLFMLRKRGSIVAARNGGGSKSKTVCGESFRVVEIRDPLLRKRVIPVIEPEE